MVSSGYVADITLVQNIK